MPRKKTNEEYLEELFQKEINYEPLEEYKGATTKIKHRCLNNHTWLVTPSLVLGRHRQCPLCTGKRSNTEEYQKRLMSMGLPYKVVGTYYNQMTKCKLKCDKGHIWSVRPTDVLLHGFLCRSCNPPRKGGLDLSKPAMLYYIKIGDYYKIGVTGRSLKDRFTKDSDKAIELLMGRMYSTGRAALAEEKRQLFNIPKNNFIDFNYLESSGNTEVFKEPLTCLY